MGSSLIDDTVKFEQLYHSTRIQQRKYDVSYARYWYYSVKERIRNESFTSLADEDLKAFLTALVESLMPTSPKPCPDTFHFDSDRLQVLKTEIDSFVYEMMCCEVLKQVARVCDQKLPATSVAIFRTRLLAIVGDAEPATWDTRNIAIEIARNAAGTRVGDTDIAQSVEKMLQKCFSDSDVRHICTQITESEMISRTFPLVREHVGKSPQEVSNAMGKPSHHANYTLSTDRLQHMILRLAHVAILHWQIWKDIVYTTEDLTIFNG